MASKVDISALDLNKEEVTEISGAVFEKELVQGVLSTRHEIMTGIKHDKQIPFVGRLSDFLKAASGCTPNEGGQVALTEKIWTPKTFAGRLTHCADDLTRLFKMVEQYERMNPDFYANLDGAVAIVSVQAAKMLREVLPDKIWFSNTTGDLVSNGGDFTTSIGASGLALYTVIDGLWKQIFAEITAGSTYHVNIAANEEASKSAQLTLASDVAYGLLEDMIEKADPRLLEDPTAKFYISRTLADNYKATLRNKGLSNGFIEITEDGKTNLMFDGRPLEIMYEWDRFIQANQDNGTIYNLPHRILFTTPGNIPVGTVSEADFETLDAFYDRYQKKAVIDIALSLDAKFLEDYMAVAAY